MTEVTSKAVAALASKAMRAPETLTLAEIKALGASALTQAADKPKPDPDQPPPRSPP